MFGNGIGDDRSDDAASDGDGMIDQSPRPEGTVMIVSAISSLLWARRTRDPGKWPPSLRI